jgi:hypothetical protein
MQNLEEKEQKNAWPDTKIMQNTSRNLEMWWIAPTHKCDRLNQTKFLRQNKEHILYLGKMRFWARKGNFGAKLPTLRWRTNFWKLFSATEIYFHAKQREHILLRTQKKIIYKM